MRRVLLALLILLLPAAAQSAADVASQVRALRKAGRLDDALAAVQAARAQAPRDELLAGLQGLCLLDAGRLDEAAAVGREFPGYAGAEPRLRTLLGRLAQHDGRWDEALAHFEAALAADGRLLEPAVEATRTLMAAGRFGAAVSAAARVEAIQPELGRRLGAEALVAQGDRLQQQGQENLGLAADKLAAAFDLRPEDHALGERLLELQVQLLRIDLARPLVERLFPGDEQRATRLYWEGRCRDALNDAAGARESWNQALALHADLPAALLELARLDLDDAAFESALQRLARIPPETPPVARRLLLTGLAEEGLQRDGPAEEHLRAALQLEPGNTKAAYHLGRLLVRTGRQEEGRELLARVAGTAK
jgi:tetratricopeptide (TPR) repeat protein